MSASSSFIIKAWWSSLKYYPGTLRFYILMLFWQIALLEYEEPKTHILSPNPLLAFFDPNKIDNMLNSNLVTGRIFQVSWFPPFVCYLLGLVSNSDNGFRKIDQLSFPLGSYINNRIRKKIMYLYYTTIDNMLKKFAKTGRYCIILKRDLKTNFTNILITPNIYWLLEFCWRACSNRRNCISFRLWKLLFILILFAEALHLILWSFSGLNLEHYLNNFVILLPAIEVTLDKIWMKSNNYATFIDIFTIPQYESKDLERMVVLIFGIRVDTNVFTVCLPRNKFYKAYKETTTGLNKRSMILFEA